MGSADHSVNPVAGTGRYSLEQVMEELQTIKTTQKRYADQYLSRPTESPTSSSKTKVKSFSSENGKDDSVPVPVSEQGQELQKMSAAIQRLENIIQKIACDIRENDRRIDDLEQYGRRNCLILHGCVNIPQRSSYVEFESFVIKKLNSRLNLDYKIKPHDIDICHILPSRKPSSAPIIIKFVRRSVRELGVHEQA